MTDQKQSETHKLEDLPGVGKRTAEKLRRAGIVTVRALRAETSSHLSEKTGIPQTAAQKVIQAAEETGIPQTTAQKVIQAWRAKYRALVRRALPWVAALTATVALSAFVIGLTWGTTKWEREQEQLRATVGSLELRLLTSYAPLTRTRQLSTVTYLSMSAISESNWMTGRERLICVRSGLPGRLLAIAMWEEVASTQLQSTSLSTTSMVDIM